MATGIADPCGMMARWIAATRKEIESKERRIHALESLLREIKADPASSAAYVEAIEKEIAALASELEVDRHQLQALEEEYAASCHA